MKAALILIAFSCALFASHVTKVSSDMQTENPFPLNLAQKGQKNNNIVVTNQTLDNNCTCVDKRDLFRTNAMYYAVTYDDIDIVSVLADIGTDPSQVYFDDNSTLLHAAAWSGSTRATRWLIERGIDVNVWDGKQWTPLHTAAWWGQLAEAELLVELGACINCRENRGKTPLWWAIQRNYPQVVDFLKSKGGEE